MNDAEMMKARLDDEWNITSEAKGQRIEGRVIGRPNERAVVFGRSPQQRRNLLLELPSAEAGPAAQDWDGLAVRVIELGETDSDTKTWIDLECTEASYDNIFRALCRDVLDGLSAPSSDPTSVVLEVLDVWISFWKKPAPLSRAREVGLLGELVFIRDWLYPVLGDRSIDLWTGPRGLLHDFASEALSVEVKTASGNQSSPVHHIQSLEQLDRPSAGLLYLASFQILEDPLGDLSVERIIGEIEQLLGSAVSGRFATALAALELPIELPDTRWRVVGGRLYEVDESFPALTRDRLRGVDSAAIPNVSYSIAMAACTPWLKEDHPSKASVVRLMSI